MNEEAKQFKANAAAELVTLEGSSDNPALLAGGVIRVSGEGLGSRHLTAESFGQYRLLRLTHHVDAKGNYRNTFVAIPHLLDVPPIQPTYAPPQGQPELAEVIDDRDPQQLGRLRVRYYWPVETPHHAETDWLRLLTPYAGHGKGYLMKPEVGSQVLVGYQGGLAEQPFVLGNLFHAKNQQGAKYSPAGNLLKGLQTAGGNKLVMQDAKGAQTILLSNSNNKGTAIQVSFAGDGSVSISTNGPINLTAGGDISLIAKQDITLTAGNNITLTAKKNLVATAQEESLGLDAKQALNLVAEDLAAAFRNNLMINASGQAKIHSQDTD